CLTYFKLTVFDDPCNNDELLKARITNYPFSKYAAKYWGYHIRDADKENWAQTLIIETFLNCPSKFESMNEIREYLRLRWSRLRSTGKTLLHIIGEDGLYMLFKEQLYE